MNTQEPNATMAVYLDLENIAIADLDELRRRLAEVPNWKPTFAERRSTRADVVAAIRQFVERTLAGETKK